MIRCLCVVIGLLASPAVAKELHEAGALPPSTHSVAAGDKPLSSGAVAGRQSGYAPVAAASSSAPAPAPAPARRAVATGPARFGVNLSGCEFKGGANGVLCPNVADVEWYAAAGFTLFRVPVVAATPLARIAPAIDAALARRIPVVIDWHEFKWPSAAEQVAFWRGYAKYKGNPLVVFDLQNEPKGFDSLTQPNDFMQWALDTKAIIAALRADGVTNTIAVEWPQWSATFRFDKGPRMADQECNSAACALDRVGGLGDANVLYQGHQYFDRGSSGTVAKCDAHGLDPSWRLALAKRGLRGFLGESAFGSASMQNADNGCQQAGKQAAAEIKAHPETFFGVTWWGGGRAWNANYIFAIAPKGQANADSWLVRTLAGK